MSYFKIRSLMIHVADGRDQYGWGGRGGQVAATIRLTGPLAGTVEGGEGGGNGCGCSCTCSCTCTRTNNDEGFGDEAILPEGLAALKAQLQQALKQVEAREQALEAELQPQTLDEVTRLERELTNALRDLQARRDDLQKTSSR